MNPPAQPAWTHGSASIGALPAQHWLEYGPADRPEAVELLLGCPQHLGVQCAHIIGDVIGDEQGLQPLPEWQGWPPAFFTRVEAEAS